FFQAEDGIRDFHVTGVQTCALPVSVAEEPSSEMPSTCRPWSPCATTQTSSGSMKSSGRPESHQSWPSPPSCESSSSSQTPSSETSAAGSIISLDQHGYSSRRDRGYLVRMRPPLPVRRRQ